MVEIAPNIECGSISLRQFSERCRQFPLAGHSSPANQDRNYKNTASQCRFDLDSNKVVGVIYSPPSIRITSKPPFRNHSQ